MAVLCICLPDFGGEEIVFCFKFQWEHVLHVVMCACKCRGVFRWGQEDGGKDTGRFSELKLEWGESGRTVDSVHDIEICFGQDTCPAFLIALNGKVDTLYNHLVCVFTCTIAFWVETG